MYERARRSSFHPLAQWADFFRESLPFLVYNSPPLMWRLFHLLFVRAAAAPILHSIGEILTGGFAALVTVLTFWALSFVVGLLAPKQAGAIAKIDDLLLVVIYSILGVQTVLILILVAAIAVLKAADDVRQKIRQLKRPTLPPPDDRGDPPENTQAGQGNGQANLERGHVREDGHGDSRVGPSTLLSHKNPSLSTPHISKRGLLNFFHGQAFAGGS